MKNLGKWGSGILTSVVVLCAAAMADPPSRVARLQYMQGDVSVQPGGVNDWVAGVINRPMTTADRLWTDKDSRAELHLGTAAIRVSAETSLTLTNLTDETVQVELDQGTLNLRVRHLYRGEIYEVDTPNMAFTVTKSGEYRFDVDPNGDTTLVTVRRGEGEATGQGRAVKVKHDQQARFTGGTSLTHQVFNAPGLDGFDDWSRIRDKREDHYLSARYVSPYVIGAEDLDDYGMWRVVPAYGAVWVPAVAPGWAPYHYGHWVWLEPWGWTWIDDAPWGFAPCHYGRWVYYSGYWAWVPGPVLVRPVYAPALVAWVGGSRWGISLFFGGGGGVGWFPLGYGEPYFPAYATSRNYFRNVNVSNTRITNITNVTNNYYNTKNINSNNTTIIKNETNNNLTINGDHNNVHIKYANQTVPGAVTAVPKTVLTSSQPVAKAAVQVPANELQEASVATAPSVAPSRTSVLGMKAGVPTSVPPAQATSRQVVARVAAPPKPLPFAAKQEALATNPGQPLDRKTEDQIRIDIARQPMKMRAEPAATGPSNPKAAEVRSVPMPSEKAAEMSQPAPSTPFHNVPRPPEKRQVEQTPATAATEKTVLHPPEGRSRVNAETPRIQDHDVPRPTEKLQVENTPAAAATAKTVPHPPEGRPRVNAETPRVQDHTIPRPTEKPQVEKPAPATSAENTVPRPSEVGPGPNAETPRVQDRAVPRPQDRVMSAERRPTTTADTPRAQDRPVPQPPVNAGSPGRETPRHESAAAEPRHSEPQPSSPRSEPSYDRARSDPTSGPAPHPSQGGAPPNAEARAAHPAPQAQQGQSGGREARPQQSGTAQSPHGQEQQSTPHAEQPH